MGTFHEYRVRNILDKRFGDKGMGKLLFFDVDGTLVDFGKSEMSENTKQALLIAKKNGHKILLCTGRSYNQIYPSLREFPFDGVVAAAGGYVILKDELIAHHTYGEKRMEKVISTVGNNNTGLILQTKDGSITSSRWAEKFICAFSNQYDMKVIQDNPTFKDITIDDDIDSYPQKYPNVESTIYCNCDYHIDLLRELLGNEFVVTLSSFKEPEPYSGEITLAGVNKATGIQCIVEALGMSSKDTVGFGDGQNDFDMIKYCGIGVAMGNANDELKKLADIVTDDIKADGLYNAMKNLKLI